MLGEFFKEKSHRRKSGDDSQKELIPSGRGKTNIIFEIIILLFLIFYKWNKKLTVIFAGPGVYHVMKCGASGHNIRSRPSLKASAVGMLALGNTVGAIEDVSFCLRVVSVNRTFIFGLNTPIFPLLLNNYSITF